MRFEESPHFACMESYREPGGYDIYKNDIQSDDIHNFEIDTRKNFWETLEQHLNTRYNMCAEAISDWESGRYLRVGPGMSMTVGELLEHLEEWYTSVIVVHRVPTLLAITKRVLNKKPLFTKALMEYQRKHGYQRTEDTMYIYFDITS